MSSGKAEKNLWRCQLQREHFGLDKGRTEQGQRDGADRGRERETGIGESSAVQLILYMEGTSREQGKV